MSTRCNIAIYDSPKDTEPSVLLYHHTDGYPEFMMGKLTRFLNEIYEILKDIQREYWWDGERVGAMMVMLSSGNYENPGLPIQKDLVKNNDYDRVTIPSFQPCMSIHGDIEYYWRVTLLDNGNYKISYEKR